MRADRMRADRMKTDHKELIILNSLVELVLKL